VTFFLLVPRASNPLTFALSSYKTQLNTIPSTYYDYHAPYEGTEVYAGASPAGPSPRRRENATLVMLASNSDVNGAVQSVYEMEARFNHKYNYPWIFLNNEEFSDEFKSCAPTRFSLCLRILTLVTKNISRVSILMSGPVYFGQIPEDHWHQPPWIDEAKATEERLKMIDDGIGRSESVPCAILHLLPCAPVVLTSVRLLRYRNMCRFFSGVRSTLL
jgi:alpha 1,2-mannosyltransferase